MRFNEIKGFENRLLFVCKFTKNEYVDDFLRGSLYMNNYKYFANQELKTMRKGQGDSYEGTFVALFENGDIYEDDKLLATAEEIKLLISNDHINSIPLLSLSQFNSPDFEVLEENEESIFIKSILMSEEITRFKEDFQPDKVILIQNYAEFKRRIENAAKKANQELWINPAQYVDFSSNNKERYERLQNGHMDILINKDESLTYQRELRFVLPQLSVEEYHRLEVGDLSDICLVYPVDEFFSGIKMNVIKPKYEIR